MFLNNLDEKISGKQILLCSLLLVLVLAMFSLQHESHIKSIHEYLNGSLWYNTFAIELSTMFFPTQSVLAVNVVNTLVTYSVYTMFPVLIISVWLSMLIDYFK
jgi:hypothetical protein